MTSPVSMGGFNVFPGTRDKLSSNRRVGLGMLGSYLALGLR